MKWSGSGIAGGLLIGTALLVGIAALQTVADEPVVAQDEPQGEAGAEQPAAPAPEGESGDAPAAGTDEDLEGVLRILATGGAVPNEVRDPAFDYYIDLSLVGTAWVDLDPSLMADLALQFLEGERVLRRPHRAIPASEVAVIATRLAIIKNDQESLARLEKAIEESGNEQLTTQLNDAKAELAELQADATWSVPVATTSALEFARYKGVLQDIEAAIVVRDRETLQELESELQNLADLPDAQRQRLQETVKKAVARIPEEAQQVGDAATALEKLAHASRSYPPGDAFTSGYSNPTATIYPSIATQCTSVPTECQVVATSCPSTASATQCSGVATECQVVATSCPGTDSATQCESVPTECPATPTECQMVSTSCPEGSVATQCPATLTECPSQPTVCPQYSTICSPQQCITQQPSSPTQCQAVQTQCPPSPTTCPPGQCEQPTQYPSVPTQCQAVVTQCKSMPTQCSSTQTKSCGKTRPTLFPGVPTRCPSILTRCPQSPTYCPANCGQQQQQKQRWVPPKKSYPGGYYQQSSPGQDDYPSSPYRRRDDFDLGR